MSIYKNGVWTSDASHPQYLVNNFGETNTLTDWTVSGTISNNVLTLTGASPQLTSKTFTVNPDDILVIEFSLAFTTLSDNSGVYIGSKSDPNTSRWIYNTTTKTWTGPNSNASSQWSTYWLSNYNSKTRKTIKSYLIGSNVDVSQVPPPEGTDQMIQLNTGNTATNIRTGYNANTGMTFEVYYFKIYKLTQGFSEVGTQAKIGKSWVYSNDFIEI